MTGSKKGVRFNVTPPYAHRFVVVSILFLDLGAPFLGSDLVLYETVFIETAQQTQAFKKLKHQW